MYIYIHTHVHIYIYIHTYYMYILWHGASSVRCSFSCRTMKSNVRCRDAAMIGRWPSPETSEEFACQTKAKENDQQTRNKHGSWAKTVVLFDAFSNKYRLVLRGFIEVDTPTSHMSMYDS